mgnify:FL=1
MMLVLLARPLSPEIAPELVIWNVGQGQWVTLRDTESCRHFDMGGEFAPWRQIIVACRELPNRVSFSHWDWDHVSFAGQARGFLPEICVSVRPGGVATEKKERGLSRYPPCPGKAAHWVSPNSRTANASSHVYLVDGILIPGDSSRAEEKIWSRAIAEVANARVLVLGHHGSRTSTSKELLRRLPRLRLAIASARERRYGHPHPEVMRELRMKRVPVLKTEDWGTIRIAL